MRTIYRTALTACAVFCYTAPPVWGLDHQKVIDFLEAAEDWETAYSVVKQDATQANTYRAWRNLADKYAGFDINGANYLRTWQLANQANQVEIYQDFLQIRPGTLLNVNAIHSIYGLTCGNHDIDGLLYFIETYPDTVEAIEATLIVQELTFSHAKKLDTPESYDTFLEFFPVAQQVPEAMELAFQAERRTVEAHNAKLDAEKHQSFARQIFNDARVIESEANPTKTAAPEHQDHVVPIAAARKYRLLLELPMFRDTKVVTELLDRHERTAYHRLELAQLEAINHNVKTMNDAIVEALQMQIEATKHQGALIAATVQNQTDVIQEVGKDITETMNKNTATITTAVNQVRDSVDNVTVAVNRVKDAVDNNTAVVSASIDRVRAAVDNNTAVVSGAINNNTKVVSQAVQQVKASVDNVGNLFETHNRLLDQQLLLLNVPAGAGGGGGAGNGVVGGVANQVVASAASTACEYTGKVVGGAAGAVYGGPVGAAVGTYAGSAVSKLACSAVGKGVEKVKEGIKNVTKQVTKVAKKVGNFFKGLWGFYDFTVPGRTMVTIAAMRIRL